MSTQETTACKTCVMRVRHAASCLSLLDLEYFSAETKCHELEKEMQFARMRVIHVLECFATLRRENGEASRMVKEAQKELEVAMDAADKARELFTALRIVYCEQLTRLNQGKICERECTHTEPTSVVFY